MSQSKVCIYSWHGLGLEGLSQLFGAKLANSIVRRGTLPVQLCPRLCLYQAMLTVAEIDCVPCLPHKHEQE